MRQVLKTYFEINIRWLSFLFKYLVYRAFIVLTLQNLNSFIDDLHCAAGLEE